MTNAEVRLWYHQRVKDIGRLVRDLRQRGVAVREVAQLAWRLRRSAVQEARGQMGNADDVEVLRMRNLAKYADPDGPSFEYVVERARERRLTGDDVYEEVIRSALRTDPVTNLRVLGANSPPTGNP